MKLQVAAIQFSQGNDNNTISALKLRKNAFQTNSPVEWIREVHLVGPEQSMVAYAIEQVIAAAGRVTIQVKFRVADADVLPASVVIRAVPPLGAYPGGMGPVGALLAANYYRGALGALFAAQNTILGEVKEQIVPILSNGETPFISFELKSLQPNLWRVGIFQAVWFWQFRENPQQPWKDFDISRHKVYLLLKAPTLPFSQNFPEDLLLPWTDILDFACEWAAGARTEDEVSSRITSRLFNLGPSYFEYNCVNALPAYVQVLDLAGNSFFNCTNFLLHLKTNSINRFIICSDCAAIVSTFANILGCDLWQSKMETPGVMFRVNRILAIGGSSWQTPCGVPGFSYHEVAWKGNCTAADPIFDACLAVDGTSSPFDLFSLPVLPENVLLGNQGSGLYRDRLVVPADWILSEPRPETRLRRMLMPGIPRFPFFAVRSAPADEMEKETLESVKRQLGVPDGSRVNGKEASARDTLVQIRDFSIDGAAFPEWKFVIQDLFEGGKELRQILQTRWTPLSSPISTLQVDIYECPSPGDAQELALKILITVHTGTANVLRDQRIGDATYSWGADRNILFTRYNMVVAIRNSSRVQISAIPLAEGIDGYIAYFVPAEGASGSSASQGRSGDRDLAGASAESKRKIKVGSSSSTAEQPVNRWQLGYATQNERPEAQV